MKFIGGFGKSGSGLKKVVKLNEKEVIGMSLEVAIKILNYNGPVFSKERIKLDTPEALFEASYRMIGGLNR